MSTPILGFTPIFIEKPWGGHRIGAKIIGEQFLISTVDGFTTETSDSKILLSKLIVDDPETILGPRIVKAFGASLPVYLKQIWAEQDLSIQVHPNNTWAQSMGLGRYGKSEAWYILDAVPNAAIYLGLKAGMSRTVLEDSLRNNSQLELLLNRIPVKPGEMYSIPAGTIHAIGAGVTVLEPQQASNVTFRVYDWQRLFSGKPRTLHIDEALKVIDFSDTANRVEAVKCVDTNALILQTPYMTCHRYSDLARPVTLSPDGCYHMVYAIDAPITLTSTDYSITIGERQAAFVCGSVDRYTLCFDSPQTLQPPTALVTYATVT